MNAVENYLFIMALRKAKIENLSDDDESTYNIYLS